MKFRNIKCIENISDVETSDEYFDINDAGFKYKHFYVFQGISSSIFANLTEKCDCIHNSNNDNSKKDLLYYLSDPNRNISELFGNKGFLYGMSNYCSCYVKKHENKNYNDCYLLNIIPNESADMCCYYCFYYSKDNQYHSKNKCIHKHCQKNLDKPTIDAGFEDT